MTDFSSLIQQEIAGVTGLPVGELDADTPFAGFGIESLQAVTIAANLSQRIGREVPVTLFFDYPTIRDLSAFLSGDGLRAQAEGASKSFEPLAIVGLSCRFPGAESAEKFWYNLTFGVDSISETPPSRWNWRDYPDAPALRWGGFLPDIESFDNEMFGIAEGEAAKMDPQQRLLLHCVHEAVENAGLSPRDLQKTKTGVFVGISSSDFSLRRGPNTNVFDATGNAHSIAANRISYIFNLKGPSLSLDTACSSSLVAIHEAGKSLAAGECDLAIVGGVNVILEPEITRAFSEAGMLAPDGRCKTFSQEANGYVRGEGAGVVLLQRLKDADPRRVVSIIRSSAVNHDGKTNGLTAPSGPAQEEVIREALRRADLTPDKIDFIEAHGTGTALGDPIEFLTLARVFGDRTEKPLRVGSAKAFVGHLEAAAGICGIIKSALSLKYGKWPRQLHFTQLNPKMETRKILVADETIELDLRSTTRAAISSFGFGGTNAHVILESAPAFPAELKEPSGEAMILAFSATSESALKEFGKIWTDALGIDEARARELIERSAAERLQYAHRVAVWGQNRDEILAALECWQKGEAGDWSSITLSKAFRPKIAFAFTGQGSQYPGMALDLFAQEPEFRAFWLDSITRLDAYFPAGLLKVIKGETPELSGLLYQTDYGQAILFSLELALAKFLEKWGIFPEIALGHSLGELAAAAFAGAVPDPYPVVAARGRLMQAETEPGAMISVSADGPLVAEIVRITPGLEIAAFNGPNLFTLTGSEAAVAGAMAYLEKRGARAKKLPVTRAFHSSLMDRMMPFFRPVLDEIHFSDPKIRIISSLTGKFLEPGEYSSNYWARQAREPTQFEGMMKTLGDAGITIVVEIGPQPVLSIMGPACLPGKKVQWIPAMRKEKSGEWRRVVAELTLLGARQAPRQQGANLLPLTPFSRKKEEKKVPNQNELLAELQKMLAGLLQVNPEEVDPDTNLLDLGADSLLLLNAIQTIKERHGVTIAVADVFRDLCNLRAIANYVSDRKVQPVAAPPVEERQRVAEVNREAFEVSPQGAGDIRALIDRQLSIMNQQLALLAGNPISREAFNASATPTPTFTPTPSSAPAKTMEAKGVLGNWRSKANRDVSADETARAKYISDFIRRFNERTAKTKAHTQKYRPFLADNRVSAGFRPNLKEMIYTIVFDRGQGSHFKDLDGNDYVDFTMGFGVNLFGHSPEFIESRIRRQLDQGYCVGPQAELAGIVAKKACEVLGQERVAFLNSGTEAVMTAIRLARAVTGRNRVVIFEGSYHGHADVVLARAGSGGVSMPVAPGVPTGIVGDVVVLAYGEESSLEYIRQNSANLAAVLVEPVQSRYPEHQPIQFLKEIRAITKDSGTAFIFDEVICGLRVAPNGAQGYFGIKPDISSYGKILGGGMPIGAVAGSARFLNPIDGGEWKFGDDSYPRAEMTFFAGTFCKHPLTMAACDAVLDKFLAEGEELTRQLNERTAALCKRLNEVFRGYDLEANHFGSLFRFKSSGNIDLLFANLNLRGIYVWEGRNLFLSTAHSDEDLDRFVAVVAESVAELDREGFLRKKP